MGLIRKVRNTLRHGGMSGLWQKANFRLGLVPPRGTETGRICLRPFYYASIDPEARLTCCCAGWVKYSLGQLSETKSLQDIWNGRVARSFRQAMLTTQLDRVCRSDICPYIIENQLPRLTAEGFEITPKAVGIFTADIIEDPQILQAVTEKSRILDFAPKHLEIAVDSRCNLYCKSCRTNRISRLSPDEERSVMLATQALKSAGKDLKILSLLSSGEVFFSRFSLDLLRRLNRREYPHLKVDVLTNGQLLDEKMWRYLGEGADFIRFVSFSIDAAAGATYEQLRGGASWSRLLENMAFVQELRAAGHLNSFTLNFVVSRQNFREMIDFVRLGDQFQVDGIMFTALLPWSMMTLDYQHDAVHLPEHPQHEELREILSDPVFDLEWVTVGL